MVISVLSTYNIKEFKSERLFIELAAVKCGRDFNVAICGGTGYHVGAMAIGCARPRKNNVERSANVSVVSVFEHSDDECARFAAKYLATRLDCVVAVSVGIHIDDASTEEIAELITLVKTAVERLADEVERDKKDE